MGDSIWFRALRGEPIPVVRETPSLDDLFDNPVPVEPEYVKYPVGKVPILNVPMLETLMAWYEEEGGCEAACEYGCWIEPDGYCEHGHPSWLLVLGYI